MRLTDRDKKIILDLCRFNGLPTQTILNKYFKGFSYCSRRLSALEESGFIDKLYYYEGKGTNIGGLKTIEGRRKAAIRFATYKGQIAVNYRPDKISHKKLVPQKERLDVHYLLGQIYEKVPSLISAREVRIDFDADNSIPVIGAIPGPSPIIILALGKKEHMKKRAFLNMLEFVKARIISPATYVVVASTFNRRLALADCNFLPWNIAPGVLQKVSANTGHFKQEFSSRLLEAGYALHSDTGLFWQVSKNGRTYNISELVTGSTELMRALKSPPPGAYIYIYNLAHLYGVTLERGQFMAYAMKDQSTYRITTRPEGNHFEKLTKGVLT